MSDFVTYKDFEDIPKALSNISEKDEIYWADLSFENAKRVFSQMYERLSSYRSYLKEKDCKIQKVANDKDFKQLPVLEKKEYLQTYPYEELLLSRPEEVKTFYMSSGSTGEPTVWPRLPEANVAYSVMVNFFYTAFWKIDTKKTLYISAMDLGIWASGNFQFHAATYCANRHNFTFANPGADFRYIHIIIRKLHQYYDQIIIATYPSVARKLLDYLNEQNDVDLKQLNVRFMIGGEAHTIEWRHYVLGMLGLSPTDITTIQDYYGTSDSGGPGTSTPLTQLIQNLCRANKNLCKELFGQAIVPSLFQKNPLLHVEAVNSEIVVTYPGQLPLCRYGTGDTGGVLSYENVIATLKNYGHNIESLLEAHGYPKQYIWKWPFIYLTGRKDYAVSIGGAVVYPKDIEGLFFQDKTKIIRSFKLGVEFDQEENQQFVIYLELYQNISLEKEEFKARTTEYTELLLNQLLEVNDDYAAAYEMDRDANKPVVQIVPYNSHPFKNETKRHKPNFLK